MPRLLPRYFAQLDKVLRLASKSQNNGVVQLLAVSKTKPIEDIYALYKAGQRDFGENYLQEALQKQQSLAHLAINWHFIGPIQSNKTRDIASHFQWVHSVDRVKIAQRLNQQRPKYLPPLNICVQVNVDAEESKSGLLLEDLDAAIKPMLAFKKLRIRGLMAIPKSNQPIKIQQKAFKKLRIAKNELNERFNLNMDTLSMGMSNDLETAIEEGATIVRIGTAIFGSRAT
jgi:pyridoxal phosphate enzyme (YggS family)